MSAEPAELSAGQTYFGISRLGREFKLDRRTVVKRLEGVAATGVDQNGQPGWTLDAAAPALLQIGMAPTAAPEQKVRPIDQDKFYAAQLKKLQLERELKQVIPVERVKEAWLAITKKLVAWTDSLGDQLERAASLTPRQVELLERRIDEMRGELHAELTKDDADDGG